MFFRVISSILWFAFLFVYPRRLIIGREKLPKEGGVLLCGNHTSNIDLVLLAAYGLTPMSSPVFLAKVELFKTRFTAWFFHSVGAIPIDRKKADVGAIKTAMTALKKGKTLVMFPEGTRVKAASAGAETDAKTGAGMLALRTDAQVVPVYISLDKRIWRPVAVVFGDPYRPQWDGKPGHDAYRAVSEEIMKKVYALADMVKF